MLNERQEAFIEAYMENPTIPMSEVAEALGIPAKTIYNWRYTNSNGFADELNNHLQEKWEEAKHMASETIFSLARDGDFKAAKYILDYAGYAAATKIEQKIDNTITIAINGESEDEDSCN